MNPNGTVTNVTIEPRRAALDATVPDDPSAEIRIDELARRAGTTVRNVRAYQDRGLLPPPRRAGRVGLYSPAHQARLALITRLLERGYTLANIGELIAAWEEGSDVAGLLGLEAAIAAPWSAEEPVTMAAAELAGLFGSADPAQVLPAITTGVELGILEPVTDGFAVNSPVLVRAGAELVTAGVPLEAAMALVRALRADLDAVAARFIDVVVTHVFDPAGDPVPTADIERLTELVQRLRPLASAAVQAELAAAMEAKSRAVLRERLGRLMDGGRRRDEAS
jgi:DNA-binding transcriptional MerR regulator